MVGRLLNNIATKKFHILISVVLTVLLIFLFLSNDGIVPSNRSKLETSFKMIRTAIDRLVKNDESIIKIIRKNATISSNLSCPFYDQLRHITFTDQRISSQLCVNAEAYQKLSNGKYPICVLSPDSSVMKEFMRIIAKNHTVDTFLIGTKKEKIIVKTYPKLDLISRHILIHHTLEPALVSRIVSIAKMFPDTTFFDAGSNVGVFTLSAVSQGLKTVSLDANIRNLLRLRLSLMANQVSPKDSILLWNFVANSSKLQYLYLHMDCNVGGSGKAMAKVPTPTIVDTIPVMPVASDDIAQVINTKNIVMKIDIQAAEAAFLYSGFSLFKKFDILAVQMEFVKNYAVDDGEIIIKFFVDRDYLIFDFHSLKQLNSRDYKNWNTDVLFYRKDIYLTKGLPRV